MTIVRFVLSQIDTTKPQNQDNHFSNWMVTWLTFRKFNLWRSNGKLRTAWRMTNSKEFIMFVRKRCFCFARNTILYVFDHLHVKKNENFKIDKTFQYQTRLSLDANYPSCWNVYINARTFFTVLKFTGWKFRSKIWLNFDLTFDVLNVLTNISRPHKTSFFNFMED